MKVQKTLKYTTAFEFFILVFAALRAWVLLNSGLSTQDVAFFVLLGGLCLASRKLKNPGSQDEIKELKDELAGFSASQDDFDDRIALIDLRLGMNSKHGS